VSELTDASRPAIAAGMRLQWEPAQEAHVLLYPEGMVKLNGSAGAIMSRCDGVRSVADIIADIEKTFALTGIGADVRAFVAMALERHWLELTP
jgi:pyrroloquinoline quinone biosynthesis protein D